jgi:type IV pilus assembly protein PilM
MLSFDITDRQIRLVRGSLAGSKIRVNDVGSRDIPEGGIVDGLVKNVPLVADTIADLLNEKKITPKGFEVGVCINSKQVLFRELELPKPKKLTHAIEEQITAQMEFAGRYNISYAVTGEGKDSTITIMAAAVPQDIVDSYVALFNYAELKLKQLTVSNYCFTRLVLNTPRIAESMPFLCIQVDERFLNFNLYQDNRVVLSRHIKIDPADYENRPDYINMAVFDNVFRVNQYVAQNPALSPVKTLIFHGIIKDYIDLHEAIKSFNLPAHILALPTNVVKYCEIDFSKYATAVAAFYNADSHTDRVNLLLTTARTGNAAVTPGSCPISAGSASAASEEISKPDPALVMIESLKTENARLTALNGELAARNGILMKENDSLLLKFAEFEKENTALLQRCEKIDEIIGKLSGEQQAELNRRMHSESEDKLWYSEAVERYNAGNYDGFECFVFAKGRLFDSDVNSADIICHFDDAHGTIIFPHFGNFSRKIEFSVNGIDITESYLDFVRRLYEFQPAVLDKTTIYSPYVKNAGSEFNELAELLPNDDEKLGRLEFTP